MRAMTWAEVLAELSGLDPFGDDTTPDLPRARADPPADPDDEPIVITWEDAAANDEAVPLGELPPAEDGPPGPGPVEA